MINNIDFKTNITETSEHALHLLVDDCRSFNSVSKELNIALTTLFGWIAKASVIKLRESKLNIIASQKNLASSKVDYEKSSTENSILKEQIKVLNFAIQEKDTLIDFLTRSNVEQLQIINKLSYNPNKRYLKIKEDDDCNEENI